MGWDFDEKSIIKTSQLFLKQQWVFKHLRTNNFFSKLSAINQDLPPNVLFTSEDKADSYDPIDMAIGEGFILIITKDGKLIVRGDNFRGQLGISGKVIQVFEPTEVNLPAPVLEASCGHNFSVIRTADDRVFGSGAHNKGQFGALALEPKSGHTKRYDSITSFYELITGCDTCIGVRAGKTFTLFADADMRRIYGAGKNHSYQLGLANYEDELVSIPTLVFDLGLASPSKSEKLLQIKAGHLHTLYLTDENLYFSGTVDFNTIDSSLYVNKGLPVLNSYKLNIDPILELSGGSRIVKIENSGNNNCAIMDNGTAVLFGGRYFDTEHKQMELIANEDGS